MKLETKFEEAILNEYFSGMVFVDQREKEVFLSYLKGFSILFFDTSVKNIVEIGGGQSTAIFAMMAERFDCNVSAIDMNPEAIKNKVNNDELCKNIFKNVDFIRGVSISFSDLCNYYEQSFSEIGGVPFHQVIQVAGYFIDTSLDGRKEIPVLKALKIDKLETEYLEESLINYGKFPESLLEVFRSNGDEFDFLHSSKINKGLLSDIFERSDIDVVFLDSGEFSSLPEWDIVSKKIRVGGYVILHDIFFPKSFKNWLVCASILASSEWKIIYLDRSVPQGLMIACRMK